MYRIPFPASRSAGQREGIRLTPHKTGLNKSKDGDLRMVKDQNNAVTRRDFFRTAGVVGAAVATSGLLVGTPLQETHAKEEAKKGPSVDMDALIAKHMGKGPIAMKKVSLDVPATAENAALVRMPIAVDHPMEPGNFIQSVGLFIDNNPNPFIAKFDFTPESGKAAVEFRVRMAGSSNVRVIGKSNSGKLYGFAKKLQVAAGGCAG